MSKLLENLAGEYQDAGYVNLALVLLWGAKEAGSRMGRDFLREYKGDQDGEEVACWVGDWLMRDLEWERRQFRSEAEYRRALYLWGKRKEKKDLENIRKHLKQSGQVIDKSGR